MALADPLEDATSYFMKNYAIVTTQVVHVAKKSSNVNFLSETHGLALFASCEVLGI